jgi:hypothetical protein
MTDRLRLLDEAALEAALRDLAGALAMPAETGVTLELDPARRARVRIQQGEGAIAPPRWSWPRVWPAAGPARPARSLRRGLAFALVALLAVAAVAGAIGLGLPGIRIVPAPTGSAVATAPGASDTGASGSLPSAPATPSPSPTVAVPLGSNLGLGDGVALDRLATVVDIPVRLPSQPGMGSPATAWLLAGRLSVVWPASSSLPALREPGVGLLLSQFRGSLEPAYFEKVLDQGTTIETVRVDGVTGWWISGAPHEIVYVDDFGDPVFDSRRSVGDTLLWARGDVTYRIESALGRAATIALADTMR